MADQINFEERKFANLKEAVRRQEERHGEEHTFHPATNHVSTQLAEHKRQDNSLLTGQNNGILRKAKTMQGYVAEKERDLRFRPQINDQSRVLDRTVDHLVHHAQDWNQTRQ